ncbi:muscleblind-like protein 3 isoform X2 [Dysidea avara]|uniref:muscleblind-like protein 3 isoform X2 n=1 Tax=Dysidea avara TaxID=196820 RepID=UPI00332C7AF0
MRMSSSSEAKPASPSSPANNSTNGNAFRDPSWLKLDVCPEYLHSQCDRSEQECPLAHPNSSINVVDGTVTCCFDFIKDRCQRVNCRYFHPPPLIKEQLIAAGKMHAQTKTRGSKDLSQVSSSELQIYPSEGTPHGPSLPYNSSPFCEKVEVCREFMRGRCHRTTNECRFLHPEPQNFVDANNMVVVCPNVVTMGECHFTECVYGHPLPHHKLHRVYLPNNNPYPAAASYPSMGSMYMQGQPMSMGTPYYHQSMMIPMYQYPPNMIYPNYMSSPVYPSQVPHMVMGYQRPHSPSPLWTPPGVFFGADLHSSNSSLGEFGVEKQARYTSSYIKMEKMPYTSPLPDTYQN